MEKQIFPRGIVGQSNLTETLTPIMTAKIDDLVCQQINKIREDENSQRIIKQYPTWMVMFHSHLVFFSQTLKCSI